MSGRASGTAVLGVVVIGRNEGERLPRALASARESGLRVVYVDSASRDGSAARARALGVDVVELGPGQPLSAARSRNAGLARLLEEVPDLGAVQFLDGDSVLEPGWLEAGARELARDPALGAVCGGLREHEPDRSLWAKLADMEWAGEPGEVDATGGNMLVRRRAFETVGGFDEGLPAGEDPEFCYRLRRAGWRIRRLEQAMAVHAGAPADFVAWWRRSRRDGRAYAQGVLRSAGGMGSRGLLSLLLGGLLLPGAALALAWSTRGLSLLLLGMAYSLWCLRIARGRRRRYGAEPRDAWLYAAFCLLGKLPMALGALRFAAARLRRGATAPP